MNTNIYFFEDDFLSNFHPLTLTRPVFDLRTGIFTLGEKWHRTIQHSSGDPKGMLRNYLTGLFAESVPNTENILWINPRFLPTRLLADEISALETDHALLSNGSVIASLITKETHLQWINSGISLEKVSTLEVKTNSVKELKNLWDLFLLNGSEIEADLNRIDSIKNAEPDNFPGVHFINADKIFVDEDVKIEPGVVINAEKSPVYLGKNSLIMANSVIRGAVAICENSTVKAGSKIYEETTIGPVCKVAGEVANSIFHSYCNKAHDGFVGNSVFGQWCNLGADTNTSNLKNNYSTIRLTDWESGEEIETGQQFIGTIMGDHSKTGINAMLNTGTVCGVSCNIFASGYPPKLIPSFQWVSDDAMVPYEFDKAIETMQRMMARRDVELTPEYEKMMRSIAED